MKIEQLLHNVKIKQIHGNQDIEVVHIDTDSRNCSRGHAFVAIKGVQVDGHNYIKNAVDQGAILIVHSSPLDEYSPNTTYVQVDDTAHAAGHIAANWYGNPSHKLKLVGVTGTNGKTTTATLLYRIFQFLGYKAGLLSTVVNYADQEAYPATHTTPDPISLNALLAKMVEKGCEYAFMEVSSHAVDQQRISGIQFAGGVFTNLTQDHLDYHGTMDNYLAAKKKFFDELPKSAFALTNIDDKRGSVMLQNTAAQKYTYSLNNLADFKANILEKHFNGTDITINNQPLTIQFVGVFNVYNLLAVYATTQLLQQDSQQALVALSQLTPVSGRFETIHASKGFTVVVDYAHTPDALTNVLSTIHDVLDKEGRIITVVGCGGNRDKTKRPLMAQEAVRLSHQVILTSDNPRFEEPEMIINDMEDGLTQEQLKHTLSIVDRAQAIKTACTLAKKGDVVLIAGKGHEDYQDVKGVKRHFDDREVARSFIQD